MAPSDSDERSGMRLDAYLARAGLASRKEARGLIRRGAVTVDGEICRDGSRHVTVHSFWGLPAPLRGGRICH